MIAQKILTILRHAKAETGAPSQDDHERALTKRGQEAAQVIGRYLAGRALQPDRVLCSTSARTRETWEEVQDVYPAAPTADYTEKLYLASPNEILNLIAHTRESVSHLMVVGHNPGLHQLCLKLAHLGDEKALEEMALKFPTCAFAVIAIDTPWREIGRAHGRLAAFVTPKMLARMEEE